MKQLATLLIMLSGIISNISAQTANRDFRDFAWGTSLTSIQSGEKAEFVDKIQNDMLIYKDKLAGYDCNVSYGFNENDKMISGNYIFNKKYTNPQLYIQDFATFKKLLTRKYGKPTSEKMNWNKNTPLLEKHNFGQAIVDGNLNMSTVWTTGRSLIEIALTTVNHAPSMHIHYTTISLEELQNSDELQKALNKL